MKILLGTVPYGRDNVGDEAILATVIDGIREAIPNADITISTGEPTKTAKKFNLKTVPLLGFKDPVYDPKQLDDEMKKADIYIWGGATGLSDYPDTAIKIANTALMNNTELVLYSCGMNDKLNPAHFKLMDGKKKKILSLFSKLSLNLFDFVEIYNNAKESRTRENIKNTLDQASLIISRDVQSKEQIELCGVTKKVYSTSDPAILLKQSSEKRLNEIWEQHKLWDIKKGVRIIGICISAQRAVNQLDDIIALSDHLIKEEKSKILFIPMNPKTDSELMSRIHKQMKFQSDAKVLTGEFEPEEITAIASRMSLVISSRLHLLILSEINHIPIIGLSRGSKIDNFMKLFNESSSGSVEKFDLDIVKSNCNRLLEDSEGFKLRAKSIVAELQSKARKNIELLGNLVKK